VRWRRRAAADVIELLHGLGRMLQEIDAKLEDIRDLLREEDDDGEADA
jgi:hypothetical protein